MILLEVGQEFLFRGEGMDRILRPLYVISVAP
jgi:hypothetical protein